MHSRIQSLTFANQELAEIYRRKAMEKPGTRVEMTKGYKGVAGVIQEKTDSPFEIYIISLDTGVRLAGGPSAFVAEDKRPR